MTPGGSKGTRLEDALLCVSEHVCFLSLIRWDGRGERERGSEVLRTPSLMFGCVSRRPQRHTERVCDRKRDTGEKEPVEEESIILMVTFMTWERWVAAWTPRRWPGSVRHQTDASVCQSDRCSFLHSSSPQWFGFKWLLGGAVVASGPG